MIFLLNVIFGILTFLFIRYAMLEVGAKEPRAVIVGVLMGIVVFIANFGAQVV